jgi:hypothetical protein
VIRKLAPRSLTDLAILSLKESYRFLELVPVHFVDNLLCNEDMVYLLLQQRKQFFA